MKDPAVLFYTKDFLTGTAYFSDAERGQYIRLLCEQHQNGHIPENHMVSVCFSLASPVVKKFNKDEDGLYYNERMEEEILKRNKFIETRVNNGAKGGRPKEVKKATDKPLGLPTENLIGNANGNVIEDVNELLSSIEEIYNKYPSKCPIKDRSTGKCAKDKDKIGKLLKVKSKEIIIKIIETYVKDCTKSGTYIKNFSTFLNNLPEYKEEIQPVLRNRDKTNEQLFGAI